MIRYRTVLVLACAACLASVPGHTQAPQLGPGTGARIPALLVLVDTLSHEAPRYRIVRLRIEGDNPSDAILLPHDADPQLITEAIQGLQLIREHAPETGDAPAVLRVRAESRPIGGGRVLPWAARVLGDLRRAATRHVPGLGNIRMIRIWLPRP